MNTGYIPATHLPEHPLFGGVASSVNPSSDWRTWKAPEGDNQNAGVEPMDCTAEARVRSFMITVRKLFNDQRVWSARYLANISGTTPQGNDPFKVSEVFRTKGTVLESLWPNTSALTTWQDFYADPPASYDIESLLLTDEYAISPSQWVNGDKASIIAALTHCPLRAAGFAWAQDANGLYYTPPGTLPCHDFVIVAAIADPNAVNGVRYFVDDSYTKDGTDIKELRGDYQFVDIQMDTVTQNVANTPQAQSAWQSFLAWMKVILGL